VTADRVEIREARAGDHGWVLERHAFIHAPGSGWDNDAFAALVARVIADFLEERDPQRERAWIAEFGGQRVGCVYLTPESERVARLRLLFVEDFARGHGIGAILVGRCIDFAREAGCERIVLWTNSALESARRIYDAAGFELVSEDAELHPAFPEGTAGQQLSLEL
jgi:N-acetylglutamate synthase-like GNAT family acetyltransferase